MACKGLELVSLINQRRWSLGCDVPGGMQAGDEKTHLLKDIFEKYIRKLSDLHNNLKILRTIRSLLCLLPCCKVLSRRGKPSQINRGHDP